MKIDPIHAGQVTLASSLVLSVRHTPRTIAMVAPTMSQVVGRTPSTRQSQTIATTT